MLATAIYVRISEDRSGEGLGVVRQEADCRELISQRGWTVHSVYSDNDISAYTGKPRPEYERMLRDISTGVVKAVVAWHPDRLHRSPRELEAFIDLVERHGVQIATVKGGTYDLTTASGRMTARIVGAVARHESEHKSERIRRKHEELAAAGKDVGAGRPFGYEDDRITVREAEASLIREAANRALAGEPLRAIVRDWGARGVPTVTGKPWQAHVLKQILVNARISGRRDLKYVGGRRRLIGSITSTSAVWPAIIDVETSDALRALLSDPQRLKRRSVRTYLLAGGLARCGVCGKALTSRPRSDRRRSYVCASGPPSYGCGKLRRLADPLEHLVEEAVRLRIDQGALAELMGDDDERHAVIAELERVEAKLVNLGQLWRDDQITDIEWRELRRDLDERRQRLRTKLQARQTQRLLTLDRGVEEWPTSIHQRRAIISLLVEAVVVLPAVKGRNRFDPDRIQIRWRS